MTAKKIVEFRYVAQLDRATGDVTGWNFGVQVALVFTHPVTEALTVQEAAEGFMTPAQAEGLYGVTLPAALDDINLVVAEDLATTRTALAGEVEAHAATASALGVAETSLANEVAAHEATREAAANESAAKAETEDALAASSAEVDRLTALVEQQAGELAALRAEAEAE